MGLSATLSLAVSFVLNADARALILAAQRGDSSAQAALFDAHKLRVARQITRMTGDASCVDDLVQEVFIAAFTRLATFRGDAQIETWLYTITANKVRNYWDARRRRDAREQGSQLGADKDVVSPEESLEAQERQRLFYQALGRLPDKFREAFTARALQHMSLEDASAVLGVPISTVSYRTRRAEEMLCRALGLEESS